MSEREELINLIRDEYDPRPNLGRGDYPAFGWDDGAGRIADAILADKVLALRAAADRIEALEAALREIGTLWGAGTYAKQIARAALAPEER